MKIPALTELAIQERQTPGRRCPTLQVHMSGSTITILRCEYLAKSGHIPEIRAGITEIRVPNGSPGPGLFVWA